MTEVGSRKHFSKCEKIPYPDKEKAVYVMHRIQNNIKEGKKPVRTYQCPHCNQWHLTSHEFTGFIEDPKLVYLEEWEKLLK